MVAKRMLKIEEFRDNRYIVCTNLGHSVMKIVTDLGDGRESAKVSYKTGGERNSARHTLENYNLADLCLYMAKQMSYRTGKSLKVMSDL